jgi:hypothetical protein
MAPPMDEATRQHILVLAEEYVELVEAMRSGQYGRRGGVSMAEQPAQPGSRPAYRPHRHHRSPGDVWLLPGAAGDKPRCVRPGRNPTT